MGLVGGSPGGWLWPKANSADNRRMAMPMLVSFTFSPVGVYYIMKDVVEGGWVRGLAFLNQTELRDASDYLSRISTSGAEDAKKASTSFQYLSSKRNRSGAITRWV